MAREKKTLVKSGSVARPPTEAEVYQIGDAAVLLPTPRSQKPRRRTKPRKAKGRARG